MKCFSEGLYAVSDVQVDAGKIELEGSQYLGFGLPFDLRTLVIIEVLLMGYIEVQRNTTLDPEARCYPGGAFDPLGAFTKMLMEVC